MMAGKMARVMMLKKLVGLRWLMRLGANGENVAAAPTLEWGSSANEAPCVGFNSTPHPPPIDESIKQRLSIDVVSKAFVCYGTSGSCSKPTSIT